MYCINCGTELINGEHICKGCGKLSASVLDELLAMTEKKAELKCAKCGAEVLSEQHYCGACGEKCAC